MVGEGEPHGLGGRAASVRRFAETRAMAGAVHSIRLSGLRVVPWPLEVGQMLDEHHVCAFGADARQRERFTIDLGTSLAKFADTVVCTIEGSRVLDLRSLCAEFERALGVGHIAPSLEGPGGLVGALRRRPHYPDGPAIKRRFIVWHDAHVLLGQDPVLFGRAADAIMGVAAEHEFCSDDVLLIQRAVFVGRPALDVYAENPEGQFSRWYAERNEEPLWRVVTGRLAPSVARWRIGAEVDAP
jgi:hypothetical protein